MNIVVVHTLCTVTNVSTTKSLTHATINDKTAGIDMLKHCTLDTCIVLAMFTFCAFFYCGSLDLALWCCNILVFNFTPRFNPFSLSTLNHTAKTVSTLATTDYMPRYVR